MIKLININIYKTCFLTIIDFRYILILTHAKQNLQRSLKFELSNWR